MRNLNVILIIITITLSFISHSHATTLYPVNKPPQKLEGNQGFLLIKIDVEGEGPSFHYTQVNTDRDDYLRKEDNYRRKKPVKVPLGNYTNGYYLIPFDQGIYQITRIDAPFYNLPYYLNLGSPAAWRFAIKPGHINYLGQLTIEKERGTDYINVNLFNRFAQDYQEIQQAVTPIKHQYPLALNPGYRDDFQQAITEQVK